MKSFRVLLISASHLSFPAYCSSKASQTPLPSYAASIKQEGHSLGGGQYHCLSWLGAGTDKLVKYFPIRNFASLVVISTATLSGDSNGKHTN
jgi:hypothetical protein